jgi:hypothetical protein
MIPIKKIALLFIILLASCTKTPSNTLASSDEIASEKQEKHSSDQSIEYPSSIPLGEYSYKLIMNGTQIGRATTSNTISNNTFIVDTEMIMDVSSVKNITKQTIKETLKFEPISFESVNTVVTKNNTQKISWLAKFDGKKIILKNDNNTSEFKPDEPFRFDGNFILNELIAQKFKENSTVSLKIYDPTLEPEDIIPVQVRLVGMKEIKINKKSKKVLHLSYAIENFKNIDIYIDSKGVVQKSVIIMLNNKIELVIDSNDEK